MHDAEILAQVLILGLANGALFALIGLHLYLVVRLGVSSPPWSRRPFGGERPEVETRRRGLVEPRPRGNANGRVES